MELFKRKDRVEVASKEPGFEGSYYEATVVAEYGGQQGYIVEYHNLVNDDYSGMLREVATAAEVRPTPPDIPVSGFKLYDLVDAFDNDGWWVGRITGRTCNEYSVYFEISSKDTFVYDIKKLRLHQEWVDGKWVLPHNRMKTAYNLSRTYHPYYYI
ncbi:hypothetical protein OROGR_009750 [Orobanche gracilis]